MAPPSPLIVLMLGGLAWGVMGWIVFRNCGEGAEVAARTEGPDANVGVGSSLLPAANFDYLLGRANARPTWKPAMTTRTVTSRTLRTVAAVAVAALIAAACGGDEPAVVEPADIVPEELPMEEPALGPDLDGAPGEPAVEPEPVEAPSTTSAVVEVDHSEEPVGEEAASVVIEEEPAEEPADEPAPEELPGDDDPWVRVMTEQVLASELWPEGDEDGTPYPDDLVCQIVDDLECFYTTPEPEQEQPEPEEASQAVEPVEEAPTPETTLPPEEPVEPEPEVPTTTTTPEPEPEPDDDDPWVRVVNEPVLASELWPEGAEDGTPYPDDLYCHVPSGGDLECYYTTPESEPEPESVVEDTPQPGSGWDPPVAGMVPEVHPDVPLTEWQRGPVNPLDRAYDKPRTTEGVQEWRDWCYPRWGGNCEWAEHNMYQALDYLGAHEQCVLNEYTRKAEYFLRERAGANNSYAAENFGWHRCGTVIDPLVGDISAGGRDNDVGLRLSDTPEITLAERCRIVLTVPFPDIELETRWNVGGTIPPIEFGQDCDAWAAYIETRSSFAGSPSCTSSRSLAQEWMEHHHNQHERYHSPFC
ncbi:MAG: hypothetical protein F4118_11490 [Acidimicrobiaceae bacterium]|nr:hypothetical protein [Acidimicrobiaceae bacterium]